MTLSLDRDCTNFILRRVPDLGHESNKLKCLYLFIFVYGVDQFVMIVSYLVPPPLVTEGPVNLSSFGSLSCPGVLLNNYNFRSIIGYAPYRRRT